MASLLNQHENPCKVFEQLSLSLSLSLSRLARTRHKNIACRSCTPHFTHSFSLHSFVRFSLALAFILVFSLFGGVARADSTKNSDPYKVGIKKPKTGGFVGGEIGFGGAYSYASMSLYTTRNLADGQRTTPSYQGYVSGWSDHTAIPLNVFGGYQWYFYDRPWFHFGVRVRGHIGYTNYNTKISDYTTYSHTNVDFSLTSHAIQYGVEAQFLWDFLNMGEHTLGWHFTPVGLEGSTFFEKTSAVASGGAIGTIEHDLNIETKFSYMWDTGFHYYYNAKHMVFATYKYRGYNSGYRRSGRGVNSISHYSYTNNSLMLGYAYKF